MLHHLVFVDLLELLQQMGEESSGHQFAFHTDDLIHLASVHIADQRQAAAAGARLFTLDDQVTIAIANERHAVVVQVGNDDFTAFTWPGRFPVLQDFHKQIVHRNMEPFMSVALRADQHEFPASVGVEHPGVQGLLDQLPLMVIKLLRTGDGGGDRVAFEAVVINVSGEVVEGSGEGDDASGPVTVDIVQATGHFGLGKIKAIEHPAVEKAVIHAGLQSLERGWRPHVNTPQVNRVATGLTPSPLVSQLGHRRAPLIAVPIQGELHRHAGRAAGAFVHDPDLIVLRDHFGFVSDPILP